MASSARGIWAIDIGSNALKALHLTESEEGLEVTGFDYIEHSKILSGEGIKPDQKEKILKDTMDTFVSRNETGNDHVAISVAGHNSFARFIKLPPVEQKRIPEIVKFEAVQQIPFDINEVEWDWQLMDNPYSNETEVGLFAIKNELIGELMDRFAAEQMQVGCVQISPIALHNYINYDREDIVGTPKDKAIVIIDMGAENTTLVVCTQNTVWQRSIRIGGNAFTEAIVDKFDVSFEKAEKLKRTALTSKYVRHIFSAMKPVYTDLGSEVQRSLGFYANSGPGRDKGFAKIIALGGGMKLKGVAKYLQQTLGVPVEKPDSFARLKLEEGLSTAKFHENASNFAVAYGLGVQMLADDSKIKSNLLPQRIARAMAWARKAKMITVAAVVLLTAAVLSLANVTLKNAKYSGGESVRNEIKMIIGKAQQADSSYNEQADRNKEIRKRILDQLAYYNNRQVVTDLAEAILSCLPNTGNAADQAEKTLHEAFARGDVNAIKAIPRQERKQLFVTALTIDFAPVISEGKFKVLDKKAGTRTRNFRSMAGGGMGMEGMMMDPMMMGGMGPGGMGPAGPGGYNIGANDEQENKFNDGPGFIITIEGYSPYKKVGDLLDPPLLGKDESKDQTKWGIITRFENLGKLFKNSPFELFEDRDIKHFKQDVGQVELGNSEMPVGIGQEKEIVRVEPPEDDTNIRRRRLPAGYGRSKDRIEKELVLIDPMTKEEMSKTYDFYTEEDIANDPSKNADDIGLIKTDLNGDPKHIVRDHWFRINVKLLWKGSPDYEPPKKS